MSQSFYSSDDMDFTPNISLDENEFHYETVVRVLELDSDLGIDSLPQQYINRLLKTKGFSFNVMLLGQTGVGKSTLINSLFRTNFNDDSNGSLSQKVEVITDYYELKEMDIKLHLGVIESKGFGDQLDNDKPFEPIVEYIDKQFDNYLAEELRTNRTDRLMNGLKDTRVHVCLYLICSKGDSLSPIDVITMKELDKRVHLIPLIAKSDAITKTELIQLKVKIMSEIERNGINVYTFPTDEPEVAEINAKHNSIMPFAVVASNDFVRTEDDRDVRARVYPWGTVFVDDEKHSDLPHLRDSILRINLYDLTITTHSEHYEHYRNRRLGDMWKERQLEHMSHMRHKERELINTFTAKLKAKEQELRKSEKELHQKYEKLSKERIEEKMRLDLGRQRLEEDIQVFNTKKLLIQLESKSSSECESKGGNSSKKRSNKH